MTGCELIALAKLPKSGSLFLLRFSLTRSNALHRPLEASWTGQRESRRLSPGTGSLEGYLGSILVGIRARRMMDALPFGCSGLV